MSKHFHGAAHKRAFFEGWYLKHQSQEHTLILIPSWHVDATGAAYGSLQMILDDAVHVLRFAAEECSFEKNRFSVQLGQNIFSEKGCRLHLDIPLSDNTTPLRIRGHIYYGKLHAPLRSFMGPLAYLPLPCFHQVISLSHRLRGEVQIGDDIWDFREGSGYIEKDWGHGFPAHYLWIQGDSNASDTSVCDASCDSPASFMLTIADLSSAHHRVLACSSLLRHDGKQYRLSTYQGARLHRYGSRRIDLRQGPYRLQLLLPAEPTTTVVLQAPIAGDMNRTIEEHPRCLIRCQLYRGKKLIFDQESTCGSYELA